jgi:protein-S-isoprenylcysteine O-methyltransferase Ste14
MLRKTQIMPPTYLLLCLVAIPILHFVLPVTRIIPFLWDLLGMVFISIGVAFSLAADRLFQLVHTTVKPFVESQALVVSGVYRLSRNPMYLGFALILFGAASLFGTLTPFLVVLLFVLLMETRFIRPEEKMLEQKFGEVYLGYKKCVRRWI